MRYNATDIRKVIFDHLRFMLHNLNADCIAKQITTTPTGKIVHVNATPLRHKRGVEVELHTFLTSALGGGKWLRSRPC
jgi:hypothetical protein